MPAPRTQPFMSSRLTTPAVAGRVDAQDTLFAMVVAYNMRREGRQYQVSEADSLFDAVKAYNTRRLGR